jgi:hypothetical protein
MIMVSRFIQWLTCDREAAPDGEARTGVHADDRGATALEWALLLVVMAIPAYFLFSLAMAIMVQHYHMLTTLNALPLP